jgi:hypothetical protein
MLDIGPIESTEMRGLAAVGLLVNDDAGDVGRPEMGVAGAGRSERAFHSHCRTRCKRRHSETDCNSRR